MNDTTPLPNADLAALMKWSKSASDAAGNVYRAKIAFLATQVYWRDRKLSLAPASLARQTDTKLAHWNILADRLVELGYLRYIETDFSERRCFIPTLPTQTEILNASTRSGR